MLGKGFQAGIRIEAGVLCLAKGFKPDYRAKSLLYAWQRVSSLTTERSRCFMLGKGFQAGIRIEAGVLCLAKGF